MDSQLKKIIAPCVLAAVIDVEREDEIRAIQAKLDNDDLALVDGICLVAEMHALIDQRSEIVKEHLQEELDNRIN